MANWIKGEGAAGGYAGMAILLLSTTGILLRYLLTNYTVSPVCIAFWRNTMLCLLLGVFLELFYPMLTEIRKKDLYFFAGFGLVLAMFNISWTLSVLYNGAAVATVLVYLSVFFSLLLGHLIFNERITWAKIFIAILAIVGIILIAGNTALSFWRGNLAAVGCGVFSGFAYSLYSVGGRMKMSQAYNPWTMLFYTFFFATLWLAAVMVAGKVMEPAGSWAFFPRVSLDWWMLLLLLAIGPTLFGFAFLNMALSGLPASTVNILLTAEPVLTIVWAYLLLGESLSRCQWCGSVLIIGAVFWLSILEIQTQLVSRSAVIPINGKTGSGS